MADRSKRFVELGVLASALEDPVEQQVLTDFLVNTVLPSEVVSEKIKQQVITELEKLKFIGPNESFTAQTARNRVDLDAISTFLEKTLGLEWTKKG